MKTSAIIWFSAAALILASASAHAANCRGRDADKHANQALEAAHAHFSASTLLQLAQQRGPHGHRRAYSHSVYTDSSGQVMEIDRRVLGPREVVVETVDGRQDRKLRGLKESELERFERDWNGALKTAQLPRVEEASQTNSQKQAGRCKLGKASKGVAEAVTKARSGKKCVTQQHADGATVDVMVLHSDTTTSDDWQRAKVHSMSCNGKYSLLSIYGEPITPALPTGIEHKHLREPIAFKARRAEPLQAKASRSAEAKESEQWQAKESSRRMTVKESKQLQREEDQLQRRVRQAQQALDTAKAAERRAKSRQLDKQVQDARSHLEQLLEARQQV